jgi:hypothetical protein
MPKMRSSRPVYFGGAVVREFDTDEQHARELESRGLAQRIGGAREADDERGARREAVLARGSGDDAERRSPNNRDNFEREPRRGAERKGKG